MQTRRKPNLERYSRETVMDAEQCAEWLGVSVDTLERYDVPSAFLGPRTRLYVVGEVVDFLAKQIRRAS